MQALKLVATKDMSREEWLEARKSGIGGSDAAVVAGISKYKSPIALWLEKTGQVEPEDLSDKEAVYWGNVLENVVADEFMNQTGLKVRRRNAILQHPEHSFMLANIDREIVGKNQGLECKTAGPYAKADWEEDGVPDYYYLQCQHYCAVCGFEGMWIAVLIGGQKFVYKYVPRDEEIIKTLIQLESDFWQKVIDKVMPGIDASAACSEALKKIYPGTDGSIIDLPDTAELWVKQYDKAKQEEDEATARKTEAQNALQNMIGKASAGRIADRVVEWKPVAGRKSLDSKGIQKDHPFIYNQYLKIGEPTRRFAVK